MQKHYSTKEVALQVLGILFAITVVAFVEISNVNCSSRIDTVPNSFNP